MTSPILIDSTDRLHLEVDRGLRVREAIIEAKQDIPDEFLDNIQAIKTHQAGRFAADDIHVASIPAAVIDHWFRQGFNIWDRNVTPREIVARLNADDLTKFICTPKAI